MSHARSRAVTGTLVAAWLVAAALSPAPATALALTSASPAAATAPTTDEDLPENLTPIDGGDHGSDAAPITAGRFVDHTTTTDLQNLYTFERTIPGSVVMFGVTLLDQEGVGRRDRLKAALAYVEPDGTAVFCGRTTFNHHQRPVAMPLKSNAGYSTNDKEECGSRDELTLVVFSDKGRAVPEGVPFELDVWEVPPVDNLAKLPYPGYSSAETFKPGEPTVTVEPGAFMSEAPVLPADRTVHVDLPLGRVSWFAVPVGFNEQLDALATVTDEGGTDGGATLEMRLLSPVGGVVSVASVDTDRYRETATIGAEPARVEAKTWLVSPRTRLDYRFSDIFNSEATLTAEPGLYYVAVYAGNVTGEEDATLPMDLTPAIKRATGSFVPGQRPRYSAPVPSFPEPEGAEPVAYDPSAPSAGPGEPAAAERQDDGTDVAVVGGLAGAAVLLVVAGVVLLLRTRRRQPTTR